MSDTKTVDRRTFLKHVAATCSLAAAAPVFVACGDDEEEPQEEACVTLGQEPPEGEAREEYVILFNEGGNAALTVVGGTVVLSRKRIPGLPEETVSIARVTEDRLAAIGTCPHEACGPRWNRTRQEFDCPCHHSYFREDGTWVEGTGLACSNATSYSARFNEDGEGVTVRFRAQG